MFRNDYNETDTGVDFAGDYDRGHVEAERTGGQQGRRLIAYYLCATVLGGLIGRLVSGHLTDIFGTKAPWWLWSISC